MHELVGACVRANTDELARLMAVDREEGARPGGLAVAADDDESERGGEDGAEEEEEREGSVGGRRSGGGRTAMTMMRCSRWIS